MIFILVCLSIPLTGLLLLQNKRVQNYITRYISEKVAEKLQTRISIENASFTFINRIQLKNFYIEDQRGDTLLFTGKLTGIISGINLANKEIKISRIILDDAFINFATDTAGILNLKFIIDELTKKGKGDTAKTSIHFKRIDIRNSRFNYGNEGKIFNSTGINYSDMQFNDLNLNIKDFVLSNGLVTFDVNDLNAKEKSGFVVDSLNTRMSIGGNLMHFENISLQTPYSTVISDFLHLDFNSFADFPDFVNKVDLNAQFTSSLVSFKDISFFAPRLKDYDEKFYLTGKISGQISNLSGEKIILSYSDETSLQGNFTMIGLPQIKYTFINLDIQNLRTTVNDLELLKIPTEKGTSYLNLPDFISYLGEIKYSGKFTGYLDDFVAYGNFTTDLGKISTDILLMPDTSNIISFQGRLKTRDFFIGKLFESEDKLGKISISANIKGSSIGESIKANLEGVIDSLELFKYNYRNIQLAGTFTEKDFDGSFTITDPNVELEFQGKVDFTSEKPVFNFTADVSRARPYFLNINKSDSSQFVSFLLKTNFTGKTIDDLNGEIRLVNSLFRKQEQQVQVYDFILRSESLGDIKNLTVRSDFLDGEINGNFQFSNLADHLKEYLSVYLPALIKNSDISLPVNDLYNFTYDFQFKNIHPVMSFFLPKLDIANKTHIYGFFNPEDKAFEFNLISPLISFYGNNWKDLAISSISSPKAILINSSSNGLMLKNGLALDNFKISAEVANDSSKMFLNWNAYQKPRYEGQLNLAAIFSKNLSTGNPVIALSIDSSGIFFNDLSWIVSRSSIIKDSSSYVIDSFKISNLNQELLVFGKISDDNEDALTFNFSELDLSITNIFTKYIKLSMNGEISGIATLRDPFNKPVFLSNLNLKNLNINGEDFGKGEILANWNNNEKKIHIKTYAGIGQIPTFNIEGDYYPRTAGIDFKIDLDKFKLNPLLPYADNLISDLNGIVTGNLSLAGTLKNPDLNGSLKLMKTSLLVDYLKTRYNFTNDISIINNEIVLKNFELFDQRGNKATGEGKITNNYFKDFNLDLKLETKNFEFLNTTEKDNQLFYGNIFAGGIVRVTGPPNNLQIDINARSERNSMFYIPLYGSDEIQENNFIYWVNLSENKEEESNVQEKYKMDVKGISMNFKLEVTPDAEVQLIFDPKIGDIIRGRGTGNLNILINTGGKFEIFGDMNIEEGEYLFTLQNLINKKFKVEKGGRINWNGDPSDANIDIKAFYNLRTSVYPLLEDPLSDPNSESLKKRIPVDCIIGMTGKLMNPTIVPDIALPTADQQTQIIVKNNINTQEELMKQFISLLVLNSFYSSKQGIASQGGLTGSNTVATAGVTGSELLSNQLSLWLSQISKDFNFGFNYRPGDEITTEEIEVALSKQFFNDRLSISGNIDLGGNEINQTDAANNIVGDFEINYKITDKFHVKGFNRANDNLLFQTSPYTQGVGVFYRESFNKLGELFNRYKEGLRDLFTRKKKKTQDETPTLDDKQ